MNDDSRLRAQRLLARSKSAMPIEDALRHIRERRAKLLNHDVSARVPEPDLSPAPLPDIVDDPFGYGADFAKRRRAETAGPKRQQRPGRTPKQMKSKPALDRFRIIDGGGDKPNDA